METEPKKTIHPLVAIASIAVIIFSAVGVAALTGHLPGSNAQKADPAPAAPVAALSPQAPASAIPANPKPKTAQKHHPAAPQKTEVANAERAPAAEQKPACADCGSVIDVKEVEVKGEGTGIGAVAGGVTGAVIGNQIGHGSTKTVARIAGAAGGAYAGHQIEKKVRSHKRYDVIVQMESGGERTVSFDSPPTWRAGDRVRIVDGKLELDR